MSARGEQVLDLMSDPCQLPLARDTVRGWVSGMGWGELRIADIVLAVDEALTNVMRHGYENRTDRPIHVCLRRVEDATCGAGVEIEIRDWGRQVPLEQIRGRDLEDLRPGGLGVHIIRSLMDFAEYTHAPDGGMRLLMRKFNASEAAP